MKSRITIEVDFENGKPYIKVNEVFSDDVRDKLISFFRQSLGGDSSWAKIEFGNVMEDSSRIWLIRPVPSHELEAESGKIIERLQTENAPTVS